MSEQNPLFNPQQNVSSPGAANIYPRARMISYRGLTPARRTEPIMYMAVAGLFLGLISMVAWFQPVVGLPISIVGIVLSVFGRRSSRRTFAITGLILAALGLLLALFNVLFGAAVSDYLQQLS